MSRKKWVLVILLSVIMVANIHMLWIRCVRYQRRYGGIHSCSIFRGWVAD